MKGGGTKAFIPPGGDVYYLMREMKWNRAERRNVWGLKSIIRIIDLFSGSALLKVAATQQKLGQHERELVGTVVIVIFWIR